MTNDSAEEYDERYFTELAAAFVRGKLDEVAMRSSDEWITLGKARGLRLHKFKRQTELPRVKRVLGLLQSLTPTNLLDIGSGRGTFLWPLLDAFPHLEITAIDTNPVRVADLDAVHHGGIARLQAVQMDATSLNFADSSFDVVTALEVMEHLPMPALAAAEAVRVARHFVIASVPSKEDDNPEHLQLFNRRSFEALWLNAGARGVKVDYVLNHMIALVTV